ncbi:MAG: FAD-binding oxidoreductase [Bacteroidetes bacterium]|nr:FAD-binding oxidoreductase [Bacteroidota bacterium]
MINNIFSYWELKHYFNVYDLIVVGGGIVGLSTAISAKKTNPNLKILILERGVLPNGASTKNAGFACFGSPSELLSDLKKSESNLVWETVAMRYKGLLLLRKRLGDKNIDYKAYGGYEIFFNKHSFEECADSIEDLNKSINDTIGKKDCYKIVKQNTLNFKGVYGIIKNCYEGQIDTSLMMRNLKKLSENLDIETLTGIEVKGLTNVQNRVIIKTNFADFYSKKVVVAVNGFAKDLLKIKDVEPARAQVLITEPLLNLKIKGAFHFNEGYYYFRNINNRILFGGGRNLDFKTEKTSKIELNNVIQNKLDFYLKDVILPNYKFKIAHRWAGVMGVGSEKKPIINHFSNNIVAAVRMGGMGVAIGSMVGELAAKKLVSKRKG